MGEVQIPSKALKYSSQVNVLYWCPPWSPKETFVFHHCRALYKETPQTLENEWTIKDYCTWHHKVHTNVVDHTQMSVGQKMWLNVINWMYYCMYCLCKVFFNLKHLNVTLLFSPDCQLVSDFLEIQTCCLVKFFPLHFRSSVYSLGMETFLLVLFHLWFLLISA